jgi:hypothetical protein
MSVLGTIGICLLCLNGAVFAALVTRKSRPRLRARLFNWVIRNELREQRRPRPRRAFARVTRSSAGYEGTDTTDQSAKAEIVPVAVGSQKCEVPHLSD